MMCLQSAVHSCYVYPSRAPENPAKWRRDKGSRPQKTRTWYRTWQSRDGKRDQSHGKLLYGTWWWWWRFRAGYWTNDMLIVAGHLSDDILVVAVIWLMWLDHWCVIYDSFLSLTCVVCTPWLYVPGGCSYLSYLVFYLVYYTDKPLWLDGYLWLVDKACVSCSSSVWICFPLLYILVHLYSIFPSLDILIST